MSLAWCPWSRRRTRLARAALRSTRRATPRRRRATACCERPPDAHLPTLPDAHGRRAHLRVHARRINERREQSQQQHRAAVWCGQPGHRREFAPAVSASTSVYGMMLPRPSDRSSHLPEEHRLEYLISQFCTFSIVTEGGTLAAHGLREPGRVYECRQKSGNADRAVLASDRYAKLPFEYPIYPPTGTSYHIPVQGWAERCEYESKERKAFFWSGAVGAASASHHGHGMLHLRVQVRRRSSISERHRSGRSAPSWALSPCTPMVGMIDWMGSASMRALPERAANARFGRGYQVLVRGHRPRALGTPVQAF
jgi:hypothetical protein